MTLGAMQPYLFPYLGYFQLMEHVDTYVFCGDMQYMRQGWINRNRICIHKDQVHFFTFSVIKDNYRKNINQRHYANLKTDSEKLKRYLFQSYKKAVNFEEAYAVLEKVLEFPDDNVACFNMNANSVIARYLGIETEITCTDDIKDDAFLHMFHRSGREERVVQLCNYFHAETYVNAIGGTSLYHKDYFAKNGIELQFMQIGDIHYGQFGEGFISNLSIIDVMMHNKAGAIKPLLKKYQLQ